MSRIVVVGAKGFIGKHLVRALAADTGDEIIAFDRPPKDSDQSEAGSFEGLANVTKVSGDFFNRDELSSALTGAEYVFHLVSSTNPAASSKDPFIDIDTNVRSTIELLEICVEKGVKKVIFPSSGGTVYGNIDSDLISEKTLPEPRSPYGIGKLTIEHYLRYFKFTHGLDYIVYRIANPYGPGQSIHGKQGVIPIFMHQLLTQQPITVYGDGSMVRDYIYIDDLILMITKSFKQQAQSDTYNLGSGQGETINDLIDSIEKCTGHTFEQTRSETPVTFVQRSVLDISRFKKEFDVQPATTLGEGIARTWDYVKKLG